MKDMKRYLALVKNDNADLLSETKFFDHDVISTDTPMLNVAFSGKVDGGLAPGVFQIAGPSKHFKTAFSLKVAQAFQKRFPEGVIFFFDIEFGTPIEYFEAFNLDMTRIIHLPIANVEDLKTQMANILDGLTDKDKVLFIVDSIGMAASNKEIEDIKSQNITVDMTRARSLKSYFRVITSTITIKKIYTVFINHSYEAIGQYGAPQVVGGGKGAYLAANTIWLMGRRQIKDKVEGLQGFDFVINIEKSRYIREKTKFPITVTFDGNIDRFSGLLEEAIEANLIVKPTQKATKYCLVDADGVIDEETKYSEDDMDEAFWNKMFERGLAKFLSDKYKLVKPKEEKEEDDDDAE